MTAAEQEPATQERREGTSTEAPLRGAPAEKDLWDKLSAMSGFVSGVLVAIIGGAFTFFWHENESRRSAELQPHQNLIGEIQTFEKFLPYLDGTEAKITLGLVGILSLNKQLGAGVVAYFRVYGTHDQKQVAASMLIPKYFLDTWNTARVDDESDQRKPAAFSLFQYNIITDIRNYHWNKGEGSQGKHAGKPEPAGEPPATIGIRRADGSS